MGDVGYSLILKLGLLSGVLLWFGLLNWLLFRTFWLGLRKFGRVLWALFGLVGLLIIPLTGVGLLGRWIIYSASSLGTGLRL